MQNILNNTKVLIMVCIAAVNWPSECQWYTHIRTPNMVMIVPADALFNSLAPGKFEWHFRHVIFKQILMIDGWGISYEIALIWMSQNIIDDRSTLVQVMVWCGQATSHYLSQCWPRSLSPYGVSRLQWVNTIQWKVISTNNADFKVRHIFYKFSMITSYYV